MLENLSPDVATAAPEAERVQPADGRNPWYYWHPSFNAAEASDLYRPENAPSLHAASGVFAPDEDVRDVARRMQFAANCMDIAKAEAQRLEWQRHYVDLRNRIIVTFQPYVWKRAYEPARGFDDPRDVHVEFTFIMLEKTGQYNPWRKAKYLTYLSMILNQCRWGLLRGRRQVTLVTMPDDAQYVFVTKQNESEADAEKVAMFLDRTNPFLDAWEKVLIERRFGLNGHSPTKLRQLATEYCRDEHTIAAHIQHVMKKMRDFWNQIGIVARTPAPGSRVGGGESMPKYGRR